MKLTPWSYLLIPLGTRLAVIAGVRVLVACGTRGPTDERLGPFDSTLVSIARRDFLSLHVNLANASEPGAGWLRTMDSFLLAAGVYVYAQLGLLRSTSGAQRSFQRFFHGVFDGLFGLSERLSHILGDRAHDSTVGAANIFNNLALHSVSAGSGRVSYAVRLVRRSVLMTRGNLLALTTGVRGTRLQPEFEPFLQYMRVSESMPAGEFPFAEVGHSIDA
jgi:hypothetical protein